MALFATVNIFIGNVNVVLATSALAHITSAHKGVLENGLKFRVRERIPCAPLTLSLFFPPCRCLTPNPDERPDIIQVCYVTPQSHNK